MSASEIYGLNAWISHVVEHFAFELEGLDEIEMFVAGYT